MKFICSECKTKYTISDEKVRGKVLKVKCKKCEAIVEVREATAGLESVAQAASSAAVGGQQHPAGHPASPSPRPRTSATPPPPPPEALAQRTGSPVATGRPATGMQPRQARPATHAPTTSTPSTNRAPTASGVRPAARGLGRPSSSTGGQIGGLAGSLAKALNASVSADEEDPDPEQGTIVSPRNLLEDLGLASQEAQREWFVAVRDQPVGPVTKEEVAARIAKGEVSGSSLVWREGMDDWRPLRDVHALGDILRGTGRAALPPTPAGRTPLRSNSNVTPLPVLADRSVGSVATPMAALGPGFGAAGGADSLSETDPKGPLFPSNLEPAMPNKGGSSGSLQIPIAEMGPIPPVAGAKSPASLPATSTADGGKLSAVFPAKPSTRKMPLGAWIALIAALPFSVTLALGLLGVIGPLSPSPPERGEVVRVVTIEAAPAPPELPPERADTAAAATQEASTETPGSRGGNWARTKTNPASKVPPTKNMSAEDQALLQRLSGGSVKTINPDIARRNNPGSPSAVSSSLSAQQVGGVVAREKRSVQQCYERAMRGVAQARDVRMTLSIRVGASGLVQTANAAGGNDAAMRTCVESAVRRWRFPAAGGASDLSIPVVFTAAR